MVKALKISLIICMLFSMLGISVYAEAIPVPSTTAIYLDEVYLTEYTAPVFSKDGTPFVPLKPFAKAYNAELTFDDEYKSVYIKRSNEANSSVLHPGKKTITKGKKKYILDEAPVMVNGEVYIPYDLPSLLFNLFQETYEKDINAIVYFKTYYSEQKFPYSFLYSPTGLRTKVLTAFVPRYEQIGYAIQKSNTRILMYNSSGESMEVKYSDQSTYTANGWQRTAPAKYYYKPDGTTVYLYPEDVKSFEQLHGIKLYSTAPSTYYKPDGSTVKLQEDQVSAYSQTNNTKLYPTAPLCYYKPDGSSIYLQPDQVQKYSADYKTTLYATAPRAYYKPDSSVVYLQPDQVDAYSVANNVALSETPPQIYYKSDGTTVTLFEWQLQSYCSSNNTALYLAPPANKYSINGVTYKLDVKEWVACGAVPFYPTIGAGHHIGNATLTDYEVFINHYALPCYLVNNKPYIVLTDLASFGFDVTWSANLYAYTISRNPQKTIIPMNVSKDPGKLGAFIKTVHATNVHVYANGVPITPVAFGNYLLIPFDSLAVLGNEYTVDSANKDFKLWINDLPMLNNKQTVYYPTTTVYNIDLVAKSVPQIYLDSHLSTGWYATYSEAKYYNSKKPKTKVMAN